MPGITDHDPGTGDHDQKRAAGYKGESEPPQQETQHRAAIHALKRRLQVEPRNGLAWVDLARHYAALGQHDHGRRSISLGLSNACENRFTIGSAVRFWLHHDDPEKGLDLLRKHPALLKRDPWLAAAEISVAMVANRRQRFAKTGITTLKSQKFGALHLSELASALGTLELEAGNRRLARQFYLQSLECPTDNAIAQLEWASNQIDDIRLEPEHLENPHSFEARAQTSYSLGRWSDSFFQCQGWLNDEPFSRRPAILGSFVASTHLDDYGSAVAIAMRGLQANPTDQYLLNNIAFAYASDNNVSAARKYYNQIAPDDICAALSRATWLATGGAIAFREGNSIGGRQLYRDAIESA